MDRQRPAGDCRPVTPHSLSTDANHVDTPDSKSLQMPGDRCTRLSCLETCSLKLIENTPCFELPREGRPKVLNLCLKLHFVRTDIIVGKLVNYTPSNVVLHVYPPDLLMCDPAFGPMQTRCRNGTGTPNTLKSVLTLRNFNIIGSCYVVPYTYMELLLDFRRVISKQIHG